MSPGAAIAALIAAVQKPPKGPARLDILTQPLEHRLHLWLAINPRTGKIAAARIDRRDATAAEVFIGGLYVSEQLFLDGRIAFHAAGREIQGVDVDFAQLRQVYGDRDYSRPDAAPDRVKALQAELDAALKPS